MTLPDPMRDAWIKYVVELAKAEGYPVLDGVNGPEIPLDFLERFYYQLYGHYRELHDA